MKVAVYTIALDEAQFVTRWAESTVDADYRIIADTGSRDDTRALAAAHGVTVHDVTIRPWRFDDARNASLALVPADADYCIALDMDEVLQPGWRAEIERAHEAGWTRPRYRYIWSWNPDGSPGLTYGGDKIHARHGYRWRHPVHEVLTPTGVETQGWVGLEIHHYPDSSKSRAQYLPLLEQAVREDPDDDRNAFYFARELFYAGRRDEARAEFQRHLALPSARWAPERAASMRYLAGLAGNDHEAWLLRASAEAPTRREPWVDLAHYYYRTHNWPGCYAAATRALTIHDQPLEYLCEPDAWGAMPYDLAALAAYRLGMFTTAVNHNEQALARAPKDARLLTNHRDYVAATSEVSL